MRTVDLVATRCHNRERLLVQEVLGVRQYRFCHHFLEVRGVPLVLEHQLGLDRHHVLVLHGRRDYPTGLEVLVVRLVPYRPSDPVVQEIPEPLLIQAILCLPGVLLVQHLPSHRVLLVVRLVLGFPVHR